MTPADLLTKYAAMFRAGRERRMTILSPLVGSHQGELTEYSFVVQRIERALLRGVVEAQDVELLRQIAGEFRRSMEREKAA